MRTGLAIAEIQRQTRHLKEVKGFDITLEQRLAYLAIKVGEVAREVLRLSRDGNKDVGKMDTADSGQNPGIEIYDVIWNLLDLADMAGVNLEAAFAKKATLNKDREW